MLLAEIDAALGQVDRLPEKERLLIRAWAAHLYDRAAEAERLHAEAVRKYPEDKHVTFMAGEHLVHRGRFADALPYFDRAVSLDPSWEWARFHVIDALLMLGRPQEALARARQALAARPDGDTYRWLARAQLAVGAWADACESARRALELPGSFAPYWSRIAWADALMHGERYGEAEAVLRPAASAEESLSARARVLPLVAEALSYQGRREAARRLLDDLRRAGGAPLYELGLRMTALAAEGRSIRAEAAEAERMGVGRGQLAVLLERAGDGADAAGQGRHLEAPSPERDAYVGFSAWRRGDREAAARAFTALSKEPTLDYAPLSLLALGDLALEAGRHGDAIDAYEAYARARVSCLRWGVPPPEAFRAFFACYARSLDYPRSQYRLALAHERLGHLAEARRHLDHLLATWRGADRGSPLLRDARALRASVSARERAGPRASRAERP